MVLENNQYNVQGITFQLLAEEFGTPLYIYDGNRIETQINKLKNAFQKVDLKLKYAGKSLTNINILKIVKNNGVGYDAVSINEVNLALKVGFAPQDIMYTPNCVAFSEIEEAVQLGVHVNIDNIPFLEEFGEKFGSSYPVCIRINPHITAGGNKNIQVGHVGSKFGISILQFEQALEVIQKYNLDIEGVHSHTGSDIIDTDVFLRGAQVVFNCAKHFDNLKYLDFGSGFKVAYKEGDHVTDIEELGEKMTEAFQNFCKSYGRELEIWFEPGKFLVSESGYFLVNVNIIKKSPACTFVGVDSGFNHLIRPMLYDSFHNIKNVSNPNGKIKVYNIVGNLCETDTFAEERDLEEAKAGDKLVFLNAGAYGFEMSSSFNSRPRPAEVLIYNGEAKLIRKRMTFDDLLAQQIEVL